MNIRIDESWKKVLQEEFEKPYFKELAEFVKSQYSAGKVYPPPKSIFRALDLCQFEKVKVVILGQDPYHGPNQANGLCFAVNDGVPFPPSLLNIFKEMQNDLGIPIPKDGNLENWAKQGILLLNSTLTVLPGRAGSHQKKGWEEFTDAIINALSCKREKLVFILWGRYAQEKGKVIDANNHHIIASAHPSPLSAYAGFFGSKPFSKTNQYLQKVGKEPVNWDLNNLLD